MPSRRPGRRRPRKRVIGPPPSAPEIPPAIPPAMPSAKPPAKDAASPASEPAASRAAPVPPAAVPPARPATPRPPTRPATKPAAAKGTPPARGGGRPPATPPPKDPLVGRVLGRCRIEEVIGEGRTSRVYRAHHQALDRTVAVKVLKPAAAARPQLVESFETEARAIAKIDNENVLKIYDVVRDGDLHYIVMELLEGESVLELIEREGRLDVMDALRILRQAGNGLAAAHGQGIVHRDVKPQNLVLLEDGTVKVVDFGLAAGEGEETGRVGTPHYMAPEVCENAQAEERSDIYALGIVLYHMLVGQPPYAGKDVPGILRAHIRGEPLRPEARRAALPKEVSELVRRLAKHDPLVRPTAQEVVDELDIFGGETLKEKGTLRRRRGRRGRRSSNNAALVGLLALVGGVVLLVALGSGKSGPPAPTPDPDPVATQPPVRPETPTPEAPPGPSEAELAAADRKRQEQEAADLLAAAEGWARANWKSPADTEAVLSRYRTIRSEYAKTEAGKTADTRVRMIMGGKLHPHPDKTYADEQAVETAREAWERMRPEILEDIRKHEYFQARNKIPEQVQDPGGKLVQELGFWKTWLDQLVRFKVGVSSKVLLLPPEKRRVPTPDGEGTVVEVTGEMIGVRVENERVNLAWSEVPASAIAELARVIFADGPPENVTLLMAFAYAHDLWDEFWAADLDMSFRGVPAGDQSILAEYKRRFRERRG